MADARGTSTAAPAKHAPNERQQQQARGVQQGTKKTKEAEKRGQSMRAGWTFVRPEPRADHARKNPTAARGLTTGAGGQ